MRHAFYQRDEFVVCQTADGFSLHAPGSTDEDIASGRARYLACGPGEPQESDFRRAAKAYAPWADKVIACDGGFMAFESARDAHTWRNQI